MLWSETGPMFLLAPVAWLIELCLWHVSAILRVTEGTKAWLCNLHSSLTGQPQAIAAKPSKSRSQLHRRKFSWGNAGPTESVGDTTALINGLHKTWSCTDTAFETSKESYAREVECLRREDFPHVDSQVYVDHAGATLYSSWQLRAVFEDLGRHLFTNPHSQHGTLLDAPSSARAEAAARRLTLAMCHAAEDDYDCVFTSGATGALKLVADAFPWTPGSRFVYTRDNHNSVLGIREVALAAGAAACAVDVQHCRRGGWSFDVRSPTMMHEPGLVSSSYVNHPPLEHLFAFPAESNFSGARYPLGLVRQVQNDGAAAGAPPGRWRVLVDAAKACGTAPPDLTCFPADFVALSYYKIFGYPTGLGALLVRKDALPALHKRYFGGGTVAVSIADDDFFRRREGAAGLEDGTASYLGLAALPHGFAQVARVGGFRAIEAHTSALTRAFVKDLAALRHGNGAPLCLLYGCHSPTGGCLPLPTGAVHGSMAPPGADGQGPVATFSVLRADGSHIGYREVERLAALEGILLRTGAFCNPGACALALGITPAAQRAAHAAGHVCWDGRDLDALGRPTGAVRVSFGYMSTRSDTAAVLRFLRAYFLERYAAGMQSGAHMAASCPKPLNIAPELAGARSGDAGSAELMPGPVLQAISVFPIKSCAAYCPTAWPLGPNGLALDREWALVGPMGVALTQKEAPVLATICPRLDLASGVMEVSAPHMVRALRIPIASPIAPSSPPRPHAKHSSALVPAELPSRRSSLSGEQPRTPLSREAGSALLRVGSGLSSASDWLDAWGEVSDCRSEEAGRAPRRGLQPMGRSDSSGSLASAPDSLVSTPGGAPRRRAHHNPTLWPRHLPRKAATAPTSPVMASAPPQHHLGPGRSQLQNGLAVAGSAEQRRPADGAGAQLAADPAPNGNVAQNSLPRQLLRVRVCTDDVCGVQVASALGAVDDVNAWFSEAAGVPCRLVRQQPGARRSIDPAALALHPPGKPIGSRMADSAAAAPAGSIGFCNEAQFLLVSAASVADLNARLRYRAAGLAQRRGSGRSTFTQVDAGQFRPNLVVGGPGLAPFAEDAWREMSFGAARFAVAGPCARCDMVCTEQGVGRRRGPEPLLTLASFRRHAGRIHFGVLLHALGRAGSKAAPIEIDAACGHTLAAANKEGPPWRQLCGADTHPKAASGWHGEVGAWLHVGQPFEVLETSRP